MDDDRGLFEALVGDGRPLVIATALVLLGAGAFVAFQAATGEFLPHDTAYLGMTAAQLCQVQGCRIVHFMIHDRISFGGVLVAIATMYLWLALFPMRRQEAWAWWALALSGAAGFLSFLAWLGYGYLDTWHGAATLVLLPVFVLGLARTRRRCRAPVARPRTDLRSADGIGRALLLASTFGITAAGLTITGVGMTRVFVPQDIEFMGVTADEMRALNVRLVPLIAHDRAGFGGALASCGVVMFASVLCARPSRSLRQALAVAGLSGFGTAIGIHPAIGYLSFSHLAPAVLGCAVFAAGLALAAREARRLAASGPGAAAAP